jgi:hypothetical protein
VFCVTGHDAPSGIDPDATPRSNARNAAAQTRRTCRPVSKRCAHCKIKVHRDVNAAGNILKSAVPGPWSGFA